LWYIKSVFVRLKFWSRFIASETQIVDTLKRDSSTRMIIDELHIDIDVDPSVFSLDNLTW
ncbi:MAG: hypothetical protein ACQEWA_05725, partial [Sphaerochaetaceae bacterium]